MNIYNAVLYRPIFNLLVWLYTTIPGADLGLAIIILTLLIRVVLYPLNQKAIVSQRALQKIQPLMEELKDKYKDDREKLGSAMMELYKTEKINPFASCLPLLIQLPILLAVFHVFQAGLTSNNFDLLYAGVTNPGHLNTLAFGFLDLAKNNILLAVLAGMAQFWQSYMLMNRRNQQGGKSQMTGMNRQMLYLMPIVTVFFGASLPAGLTLYWLFTTIFSILQQALVLRSTEKAAT